MVADSHSNGGHDNSGNDDPDHGGESVGYWARYGRWPQAYFERDTAMGRVRALQAALIPCRQTVEVGVFIEPGIF